MKRQRGRLSRGTWTRKTNPVESAESPLSSKNSPNRIVVKDDSYTWMHTAPLDNGFCWAGQIFDSSFLDDNKKIFHWDDRGAVEHWKKFWSNFRKGVVVVEEDFRHFSEQFSASIDWDTRWSCTLPDCAEDIPSRDEKRRNLHGCFTRKELSDSTSAVILGLPEAKDYAGRSGPHSVYLPLDFVPVPTGWDEADENPEESPLKESPGQIVVADSIKKAQIEPSSQGWSEPPPNVNEVSFTEIGWPEYPSSYGHIIPSGWGDVSADPPIVTSGWGDLNEEPRSDIQMHQADSGWGGYSPIDLNSTGPRWGNRHPLVESRAVYSKSHCGQPHDFYNNSYKYGCWKPKWGTDANSHESCGRRTNQRPGRPISSMYRVNYDPRPWASRLERSKPQWQSVGTLTHGTQPIPRDFTRISTENFYYLPLIRCLRPLS